MNDVKVSLNLMNSILQYLGNRPYIEVVQFIDQIKQEASVQNVSATTVANSTAPTVPVPVEPVPEPVSDTSLTSSENATSAQ